MFEISRTSSVYTDIYMKTPHDIINQLKPISSKMIIIDEFGRDHEKPINLIDLYFAENKSTIKLEGLENKLTFEPRGSTIHCFIAPKEGFAFGEHVEDYDVIIKCIWGTKTMVVMGKEIDIPEGSELLIPANTPHYASNKHASIMLSIQP